MENIDEIFVAVLKWFADKEKSQRQFALKTLEEAITPTFLNHTFKGKKSPSDRLKRLIAAKLGYPGAKYEDFLNIGRALIAGKPVSEAEPEARFLTADEMSARGFFVVPFSDDMKLAAGGGGRVQVDKDENTSSIIVHGPSLNRRNAKNLHAFRVGGDSMSPEIKEGNIVLVDTVQDDLAKIKEGKIYALCWDLSDGECAVKYLRWVEKGRMLSIESENKFYAPVFRRVNDVRLIGRVIWSWREH